MRHESIWLINIFSLYCSMAGHGVWSHRWGARNRILVANESLGAHDSLVLGWWEKLLLIINHFERQEAGSCKFVSYFLTYFQLMNVQDLRKHNFEGNLVLLFSLSCRFTQALLPVLIKVSDQTQRRCRRLWCTFAKYILVLCLCY